MAPYPQPAGGGGRIRTYEGISQQIYSLPPLAAWVPLLEMSRVFCGARPPLSMSRGKSLVFTGRRVFRAHATSGLHLPGCGERTSGTPLNLSYDIGTLGRTIGLTIYPGACSCIILPTAAAAHGPDPISSADTAAVD